MNLAVEVLLQHAPRLAAAAREYAGRGWPVAPAWWIHPGGHCACPRKHACSSPGKHPLTRHGLKDATTDLAQIEQWWQEHPHASVLVVTGSRSGIDVLDIDGPEGEDALRELVGVHGELPATVEALTGGGGRHLLFEHVAGLTNSRGTLPRGIDVRGEGGYIVAPPSFHLNGRIYQWELSGVPGEVPVACWPPWLLEVLRGGASAWAASRPETESVGLPIPARTRNVRLTSLAGAARRQGATEAEVLALLRATNLARCQPPLEDEEIERIAASVCRYAPAPDAAFLQLSRQADGRIAQEPTAPDPGKQPDFTDEGNLQRLLLRWGTDLRHCRAVAGRHPLDGGWLIWAGGRWEWDTSRKVGALIRDTLNAIEHEPPVWGPMRKDGTADNLTEKWYKACRADGRRTALASVATTAQEIAMRLDELDQRPFLLTCRNGVLDLATGQLRPPDRADLLTQQIRVAYDPAATCPRWLAFLGQIMAGDQEQVTFLQRAVGYALTGATREQCLFILYGHGANGKSTFIEAIRELLGDYAKTADPSTFMSRRDQSLRNDLAALRSARFVAAAETGGNGVLDEVLIKRSTGDEMVTARFLYGEFFEYKPQYKIFLATNHRPTIRGTDHGIWRRIRLVPFEVTIPTAEQDRELAATLRAEFAGILNWALQGCLDWQQHGLGTPGKVAEATADYRSEMDTMGAFLSECCDQGQVHYAESGLLYDAYRRWAELAKEHVFSKTRFGRQLRERGFIPAQLGGGQRVWWGLRLQATGDARGGA